MRSSRIAVAAALVAAAVAAWRGAQPRRDAVSVARADRHDISPRLAPPDDDEPQQGSGGTANTPPVITTPAGSAAVEQTIQGPRPAAALMASFDGLGAGFTGPQGAATLRNPSDNSLAVGPNHIVQIVNTRMAIFTKQGREYDTTGKVLYGPVPTNNVFRGFGGPCGAQNNGDAVVRYDQLADRWLIVMPIFRRQPIRPDEPIAQRAGEPARNSQPGQRDQPGPAVRLFEPPPPPPAAPAPAPAPPSSLAARPAVPSSVAVRPAQPSSLAARPAAPSSVAVRPAQPSSAAARVVPPAPPREQGSYAMCYALSTGPDPFGPYYRYEFVRPLFPDYPRPAVWPDGYYVPTSTGDDVIQKHACVVDRARMLRGEDATEQCIVVDGVNFLNNADLEGKQLPPPGAPNIILATGGTQLQHVLEDDGVYAWTFHVDWRDPGKTRLTGPVKIKVAPYHYLCDGQLTNCVPQPGTERRLDAQGDKIMARVVYRRMGNHEALVAAHSVNTAAGAGGVRWYEFHIVAPGRRLQISQQGTYAPDGFYRWMPSPVMDGHGNIGIGYSFGGSPSFVGQRFAGRHVTDPPGQLTLRENVLVEGEAAQTAGFRWQDYTQTAVDPSDDCTIWYVGDYLKRDQLSYSTRIGGFRLPGCRTHH